jgi:serine/threonine-protein kinase
VQHAVEPYYDIQEELGRGGAGIVYRAVDRRLKRSVALKILPPELAFRADTRERFMREAETSARLNHPNIVPIFSVDEREGLAWFVMALVEGQSLGDRVRAHGALPIADARRLIREVADALSYAHSHGVVHRDIKPDNILLDSQTNRAMVTDFGIARATTEGETRLTATGAAIGTPAYMSPEQCAGDRELDGRSDLYSLGAVAYYAITGKPPFDGPSTPVVMMKQVTEQPVSMRTYRSEVPMDLEQVVMKLLAKNPSDRFNDGAQVIAALDGERFESHRAADRYVGAPPATAVAAPMPTMWEPIPGYNARMAARRARWDAHERANLIKEEIEHSQPLPDRIRRFRLRVSIYLATTTFLFGINAATSGPHHFWWAIFPALGMMMGVMKEGGRLWASGARLSNVFGANVQLPPAEPRVPVIDRPAQASAAQPDVSQEVLGGSRGAVLRQALSDRNAIDSLFRQLSESEKSQLPEAASTANALYDRVKALASTLHRLDTEIGADRVTSLDRRIDDAEKGETSADKERLLRLLRRQRETLGNLVKSRESLSEQYESAGLLLQNLKLDFVRMKSAGLQSSLADLTSVTQEARALSKEIGYVLAAADELRDI